MTEFNSDVPSTNPRTAIGMVEPYHYKLVVVDGKRPGVGDSKGMTLAELSQLFYDLGCKTAYNLDGGATSSMALKGELYNVQAGDRSCTAIIYVEME